MNTAGRIRLNPARQESTSVSIGTGRLNTMAKTPYRSNHRVTFVISALPTMRSNTLVPPRRHAKNAMSAATIAPTNEASAPSQTPRSMPDTVITTDDGTGNVISATRRMLTPMLAPIMPAGLSRRLPSHAAIASSVNQPSRSTYSTERRVSRTATMTRVRFTSTRIAHQRKAAIRLQLTITGSMTSRAAPRARLKNVKATRFRLEDHRRPLSEPATGMASAPVVFTIASRVCSCRRSRQICHEVRQLHPNQIRQRGPSEAGQMRQPTSRRSVFDHAILQAVKCATASLIGHRFLSAFSMTTVAAANTAATEPKAAIT